MSAKILSILIIYLPNLLWNFYLHLGHPQIDHNFPEKLTVNKGVQDPDIWIWRTLPTTWKPKKSVKWENNLLIRISYHINEDRTYASSLSFTLIYLSLTLARSTLAHWIQSRALNLRKRSKFWSRQHKNLDWLTHSLHSLQKALAAIRIVI